MILLGTLVNTGAIIAGGLIGLLLKKGLPSRIGDSIMTAMALCVLSIGISGTLEGNHLLVSILSMAIGSIVGELLQLDDRLTHLGELIQSKLAGQNQNSTIAQGFVTASLLFCVGAMAIVGSLQSGLSNNHDTLFAKSLIDAITAVVLASTLGFGVLLSCIVALLYQGSITLLAGFLSPYLTDPVIAEMTCVGSLLIIGLSLNMLKITTIKVVNYIPAIFLPILFMMFV